MDQELEAADRAFEAALVEGDVDRLDTLLADDFTYVHGDAWTRGEPPMRTDDRETVLQAARDRIYTFRTIIDLQTFVHGDVGLIEGSYEAGLTTPKRVVEFFVRYLRVYRLVDDRWVLVTHRSVLGPEFR